VTKREPGLGAGVETDAQAAARRDFDELVRDVRPDLHRYCSRMVGSSIEGEDVVQDVLAKVFCQLSELGEVASLRGWIFKVAHNKSLDYLRRYDRRHVVTLESDAVAPDEADALERMEVATIGLSYFARLTPMQRSCTILKDVLDYSLSEIATILEVTLPATKGALHRGRTSLRQAVDSAQDLTPASLTEAETLLLSRYAERFNAHDFDGLREMLAEDVRLDLVGRFQARGAQPTGRYYTSYAKVPECRLRPGLVEGRAALLASDTPDQAPDYFILLTWHGERIAAITDYRHARHVLADSDARIGRGAHPPP
jgi:RNA polymerase sigma-70 factor (ECF subfamily)